MKQRVLISIRFIMDYGIGVPSFYLFEEREIFMDIRCSPNTLRILVRAIYSLFPPLVEIH